MKSHTKIILVTTLLYVTTKDSKYVEINSVNPLYLIISKSNRYIEEINKNKYWTLIFTKESTVEIKNMRNCGVKLDNFVGQ